MTYARATMRKRSTGSRKISERSNRKRVVPVQRPVRVGDMTPDELRAMIQDTLAEWLGDPDAGLELRPEIIASIREQRAEYPAGKRGKSLEEVGKRLRSV